MVVFETGVIYFKSGRKKVGLYLLNGLNPKTSGADILQFLRQLNNKQFYNSVKEYVEKVQVVTGQTKINKRNMEIICSVKDIKNPSKWCEFKFEFEEHPLKAINLFLSVKFNQLINMSHLFKTQEYSEAECINHIYEIDIKKKQLVYYYGGLYTNQNWEKVKTISFAQLSSEEITPTNFLKP